VAAKGDGLWLANRGGSWSWWELYDYDESYDGESSSRWGLIDTAGREVAPLIYNHISPYAANSPWPARREGKWGYIGSDGTEITPFIYDDAFAFSEDGLAIVRAGDWQTGKYGVVDLTGKEVVPLEFEGIGDWRNNYVIENGLVHAQRGGKWGVLKILKEGETAAAIAAPPAETWAEPPGGEAGEPDQPAGETIGERDFILPNSDTVKLKNSDLRDLSPEELRLARNEIYARHGRTFRDKELQAYFDAKEWYQNLEKLPQGEDPALSKIERENIEKIATFEEQ
jgi:hypothetical protein